MAGGRAVDADRDDSVGMVAEGDGGLPIGSPAEVDRTIPARVAQPGRSRRRSSSRPTRTSASRIVGIVSMASRSAPASTSASMRGAVEVAERHRRPGRSRRGTPIRRRASRRTGRPSPPRAARRSVAGLRAIRVRARAPPARRSVRSAESAVGRVQAGGGEALDRGLVAGGRRDLGPGPVSRRGGPPRWPPGRSSRSRADHSRSDRSCPGASSSVARPPSRTTGPPVPSHAPMASDDDDRDVVSRRHAPRTFATASRSASTTSCADPPTCGLDRRQQPCLVEPVARGPIASVTPSV